MPDPVPDQLAGMVAADTWWPLAHASASRHTAVDGPAALVNSDAPGRVLGAGLLAGVAVADTDRAWDIYAEDRSSKVRTKLASMRMPQRVLDVLVADRVDAVRVALAANTSVPATGLDRLAARSATVAVMCALAANPSFAPPALTAGHLFDRIDLADGPTAALARVYAPVFGPSVWLASAAQMMLPGWLANPARDPRDIAALVEGCGPGAVFVPWLLAAPAAPVQMLAAHARRVLSTRSPWTDRSPRQEIARLVGTHPRTPPALLARFADDPQLVRLVAANPSLPARVVDKLLAGMAPGGKLRTELLTLFANPRVPAVTALSFLHDDCAWGAVEHILMNPHLTAAHIELVPAKFKVMARNRLSADRGSWELVGPTFTNLPAAHPPIGAPAIPAAGLAVLLQLAAADVPPTVAVAAATLL